MTNPRLPDRDLSTRVKLPDWALTVYAAVGTPGLSSACWQGLLPEAVYECPLCGGDGRDAELAGLDCHECNGCGVFGVEPGRLVRWVTAGGGRR